MEGYRKAWENLSDKLESKQNVYAFNSENKYMNNTGEKMSDTDHFGTGNDIYLSIYIPITVFCFVHVYVYTCMHVYIYISIYIHKPISLWLCICIHMHLYTYINRYAYFYI
jgi:hypothetical protein